MRERARTTPETDRQSETLPTHLPALPLGGLAPAPIGEVARNRRGSVRGVGDQGRGAVVPRAIFGSERHTRVAPRQDGAVCSRVQPEAETVGSRTRSDEAARSHHLRDPFGRDDSAGEERSPQSGDVLGGGVDATVAAASHG